MTNETQVPTAMVPANEPDPLAMPGSPDEVKYPLLKAGKIYRTKVRQIDIVEAKKPAPGAKSLIDGFEGKPQNIKISVATTKKELTVDDETLEPGHVMSKYIPCYTSPEYTDPESGRVTRAMTAKDVRKSLLQFIFAVEGQASKTPPNEVFENGTRFIDKPVDVRVGIQEDKSGQFDPSNTIRFVIPD